MALGGWHLTDDAEDQTRWTLPDVTLTAGDFLVVHASGRDRAEAGLPLHTNFRLDADGEFLALVQPDGQTIASSFAPEFPRQVADVSYGWSADQLERGYLNPATPGSINPPRTAIDPLQSLLINEIMYHPASEEDAHEYVELWNAGTEPFSLAGWQITGGVEFSFPELILAPNQYLVVAADVPSFLAEYGVGAMVVGPWSGRLSNSRDTITLRDPAGDRQDRVTYADEGDWAQGRAGPMTEGTRDGSGPMATTAAADRWSW